LAAEPDFDRESRARMVRERVRSGESDGEPCAVFVVDGTDAPADVERPASATGHELIGNLNIFLRPYGVAELGMMVAADHRGEGVGSALMDAAIAWTRAQGGHKVSLEMWPDNEAARALYEKFGFEEEGFLRDHYRRSNGDLRSAVVMGVLLDGSPPDRDDLGA
jgi:RimJ/RimL family protein N-acetyltransferase